jgi:vitellogenic carboxypeptidase-like protein
VYIDKDCKVQQRTYSWCNPSRSCMFIDNPVQTGFSYQVNSSGVNDPNNIEYTRTSRDASIQMLNILQQFFKIFPEVAPSPFWITGESYGGNYCPNLAKVILDNPQAGINLVGISVGDPVMNSIVQWPTYADTLYGMGLVNIAQREHVREVMAQGVQAMLTQGCKQGFDFWNSVWNDNGEAPTPFYYQQYSGSSTTYEQLLVNDPASMSWSINWLATSQVQKAMHFGRSPANQQNEGGPVYDTMVQSGDFCQNSSDIFGDLLVSNCLGVVRFSHLFQSGQVRH